MTAVSVGFICPFWLPLWGGAEQYHFRLACELRERGFEVHVFCGVSEAADKDNGGIKVDRYVPKQDISFATWEEAIHSGSATTFENLSHHYMFMEAAIGWARKNGIQIALIGNPFNDTNYIHARELYLRLSDMGVKVGLIHHDLSKKVGKTLRDTYVAQDGGWQEAERKIIDNIRNLASTDDRMKWTAIVGSPLFFKPDFLVTNSRWSTRFIDPLNECPTIVLHPLMDAGYWSAKPATLPGTADILMVNPQNRKNPRLMAQVIALSRSSRTFRVLRGGWGDSFQGFRQMLGKLPPSNARNVELVDYIKDMRTAYHSAKLLLFPSFEEGYGMTPVEAMYCGTPVVSSNYPPILEAVGEGAFSLCPYKDHPRKWMAAIDEVLSNLEFWRRRSRQHADFLKKRQEEELQGAVSFLRDLTR